MIHTLQIESNGAILEQEALSDMVPQKGDCILYMANDSTPEQEPEIAVVLSTVTVGNTMTTHCVAI